MKSPNKENLVEIPLDKLFDDKYIGIPIYKVSSSYTDVKNSYGQIMVRYPNGYIYKWFIFDGTITFNGDRKHTHYYTYKDLA